MPEKTGNEPSALVDDEIAGFVEPGDEWPVGDEIYGFNPPEQLQTWVYRDRNADGSAPPPMDRGYVTKIFGPIDPDIVKERCGGGVYRLSIRRPGKGSTSRILPISGPPKPQTPEPSPDAARDASPPAAAAAPAGPEVIAEAVARALAPALAQMTAMVQNATAAPARDPLEMAIRIAEIGRNNAPTAPTSDARDLVKLYMDGMTAGQRLASDGKSVGEALAEIAPRALESFDRLVAARSMGAPASGPPAAAAGGASPASNTVGEFVIAGMLAQAVANGTDPSLFADALVVQYPAEEIQKIMSVPAAMLVAHLRRHVKMLPVLGTDQCAAFVEKLLAVLPERLNLDRVVDDDGDDEPGDSAQGPEAGKETGKVATS